MYKRVSNRDAITYIETRQEFESNTGSLRGEYVLPERNATRLGYLPPDVRGQWWHAFQTQENGAMYAVWSYGTPIAWHDGEKWVRPDVSYSRTTSRHQGLTPRDGTA